jgi:hypothetical protein
LQGTVEVGGDDGELAGKITSRTISLDLLSTSPSPSPPAPTPISAVAEMGRLVSGSGTAEMGGERGTAALASALTFLPA